MSGRHPKTWAVVPVKSFGSAKQRLGSLLTAEERAALACVMLKDVLAALTDAPSLAGMAVITGDRDAAGMAHAMGALVIADTDETGQTAAVSHAARYLEEFRHEDMLVVPADVPSVTAADIETLLAVHRAPPSLTLVPATADGGTNALLCSPPGLLTFAFGENSLRKHQAAARARNIDPLTMHLDRLGRDLDRPDDLAAFLLRPSATGTYRYLCAINVPERLRGARGVALDAPSAEQMLS